MHAWNLLRWHGVLGRGARSMWFRRGARILDDEVDGAADCLQVGGCGVLDLGESLEQQEHALVHCRHFLVRLLF